MIDRLLAPWSEPIYAALRIVAGLMFSLHGMQKLFGVLTESQPPVGSQLWIGGVVELVCGLGIAVGLFTSLLAFLASGQMAVAYFQFHWKFRFDDSFFPVVNQGELAALYCFVFLYVASRGAGVASIDAARAPSGEGG